LSTTAHRVIATIPTIEKGPRLHLRLILVSN